MVIQRQRRRTLRYIRTHWPVYFALYGAIVFAVLLIGLGLSQGWYAFVPLALAMMLVASYFLVAALYLAYQLKDGPGGTAAEILFGLAQTRPEDRVVCIDLGLRETAIAIAQRLTTGEVTVIDVYNPQSNTGAALRRTRNRARKVAADPRLNWIDGSVDLLPLPDRSVKAVYMNQILSEFWLPEERDKLLAEARRILIPEGRLLVAERVRAQSNLLLTGVVTYSLPVTTQWRATLERAGYIVRREETPRGLIYCVRADKPSPAAGKQMILQLEYV
jgi:ubiquinone/menaquinone biosynthesis C-methylase UbiE